MTAPKGSIKERLSRYREIKLSVTGRKSGKTISIPVWFVLEGDKLYLLPVQGSDTQWYKNVLQNPSIRIDARGVEAKVRAVPITDANTVQSVIEKFREKYGAKDVKKYYSKFDVAVVVELSCIILIQAAQCATQDVRDASDAAPYQPCAAIALAEEMTNAICPGVCPGAGMARTPGTISFSASSNSMHALRGGRFFNAQLTSSSFMTIHLLAAQVGRGSPEVPLCF